MEERMDDLASFGRWIKLRRIVLELSQAELAQRVGCAAVTIRKIEADERRPSPEIAARLAAALDVAPVERDAFLQVARAERGVDHVCGASRAAQPPGVAARAELALPVGTVTFLF